MNKNSLAIVMLCSHLCAGESVKPFAPAEWDRLSERLLFAGVQPYELLRFSYNDFESRLNIRKEQAQRIRVLIGRSENIISEIDRFASKGIYIMTRDDSYYPNILKHKMGKSCPPILYYAGSVQLLEKTSVGFVGSRRVCKTDEDFVNATVAKVNAYGYGVVSGGARGVDSLAASASIENGNTCIEYIAEPLISKLRIKNVLNRISDNQLLVLSAANPDAEFTTGAAMLRNKLIYAQSSGTVVVKSDFNMGGTWHGAVNNLKNNWSVAFCWNNRSYEGNIELIKRGAVPIDETWDGNVGVYTPHEKETSQQLSLFFHYLG